MLEILLAQKAALEAELLAAETEINQIAAYRRLQPINEAIFLMSTPAN